MREQDRDMSVLYLSAQALILALLSNERLYPVLISVAALIPLCYGIWLGAREVLKMTRE